MADTKSPPPSSLSLSPSLPSTSLPLALTSSNLPTLLLKSHTLTQTLATLQTSTSPPSPISSAPPNESTEKIKALKAEIRKIATHTCRYTSTSDFENFIVDNKSHALQLDAFLSTRHDYSHKSSEGKGKKYALSCVNLLEDDPRLVYYLSLHTLTSATLASGFKGIGFNLACLHSYPLLEPSTSSSSSSSPSSTPPPQQPLYTMLENLPVTQQSLVVSGILDRFFHEKGFIISERASNNIVASTNKNDAVSVSVSLTPQNLVNSESILQLLRKLNNAPFVPSGLLERSVFGFDFTKYSFSSLGSCGSRNSVEKELGLLGLYVFTGLCDRESDGYGDGYGDGDEKDGYCDDDQSLIDDDNFTNHSEPSTTNRSSVNERMSLPILISTITRCLLPFAKSYFIDNAPLLSPPPPPPPPPTTLPTEGVSQHKYIPTGTGTRDRERRNSSTIKRGSHLISFQNSVPAGIGEDGGQAVVDNDNDNGGGGGIRKRPRLPSQDLTVSRTSSVTTANAAAAAWQIPSPNLQPSSTFSASLLSNSMPPPPPPPQSSTTSTMSANSPKKSPYYSPSPYQKSITSASPSLIAPAPASTSILASSSPTFVNLEVEILPPQLSSSLRSHLLRLLSSPSSQITSTSETRVSLETSTSLSSHNQSNTPLQTLSLYHLTVFLTGVGAGSSEGSGSLHVKRSVEALMGLCNGSSGLKNSSLLSSERGRERKGSVGDAETTATKATANAATNANATVDGRNSGLLRKTLATLLTVASAYPPIADGALENTESSLSLTSVFESRKTLTLALTSSDTNTNTNTSVRARRKSQGLAPPPPPPASKPPPPPPLGSPLKIVKDSPTPSTTSSTALSSSSSSSTSSSMLSYSSPFGGKNLGSAILDLFTSTSKTDPPALVSYYARIGVCILSLNGEAMSRLVLSELDHLIPTNTNTTENENENENIPNTNTNTKSKNKSKSKNVKKMVSVTKFINHFFHSSKKLGSGLDVVRNVVNLALTDSFIRLDPTVLVDCYDRGLVNGVFVRGFIKRLFIDSLKTSHPCPLFTHTSLPKLIDIAVDSLKNSTSITNVLIPSVLKLSAPSQTIKAAQLYYSLKYNSTVERSGVFSVHLRDYDLLGIWSGADASLKRVLKEEIVSAYPDLASVLETGDVISGFDGCERKWVETLNVLEGCDASLPSTALTALATTASSTEETETEALQLIESIRRCMFIPTGSISADLDGSLASALFFARTSDKNNTMSAGLSNVDILAVSTLLLQVDATSSTLVQAQNTLTSKQILADPLALLKVDCKLWSNQGIRSILSVLFLRILVMNDCEIDGVLTELVRKRNESLSRSVSVSVGVGHDNMNMIFAGLEFKASRDLIVLRCLCVILVDHVAPFLPSQDTNGDDDVVALDFGYAQLLKAADTVLGRTRGLVPLLVKQAGFPTSTSADGGEKYTNFLVSNFQEKCFRDLPTLSAMLVGQTRRNPTNNNNQGSNMCGGANASLNLKLAGVGLKVCFLKASNMSKTDESTMSEVKGYIQVYFNVFMSSMPYIVGVNPTQVLSSASGNDNDEYDGNGNGEGGSADATQQSRIQAFKFLNVVGCLGSHASTSTPSSSANSSTVRGSVNGEIRKLVIRNLGKLLQRTTIGPGVLSSSSNNSGYSGGNGGGGNGGGGGEIEPWKKDVMNKVNVRVRGTLERLGVFVR